jgi:tRNA(fMet)-specific endonuclease VapC
VSCFILDTDTFTLYLQGDVNVIANVVRHLADDVRLSVVSVEEIWDGWRAAIHRAKTPDAIGHAYDRLTATLDELRRWPVASNPASAIVRYRELKKQKLNVGTNDLRIAAIALERDATVVTRNRRDFARMPDLRIADWSEPI